MEGSGKAVAARALGDCICPCWGVMLDGDPGSVVDSRFFQANSKNLPYDSEWDLPTTFKQLLPMILGA